MCLALFCFRAISERIVLAMGIILLQNAAVMSVTTYCAVSIPLIRNGASHARIVIARGLTNNPYYKPAEDEGFDCQFAMGKLYGGHQFLNWWKQMSAGLLH